MSDTDAIDEKKGTTDSTTGPINFVKTILVQIICICVMIAAGSLFLYTCKIAQSSVLPTCLFSSPYSDVNPIISEVIVDINIVKTKDATFSTKLIFPLEENLEIINKNLGWINDWKTGINSSSTKLWVATIIEQIISINFTIKNIICTTINSIFPESFIVFFGILFACFIHMILGFVNFFLLIYLWFSKIGVLFSEKSVTGDTVSWKSVDMFGITNWWWGIFYVFCFMILFFLFGITLIIPTITMLISMFCTWFPLYMKAKIESNKEEYGVLDTIKNIFKFKLNIIMIIISIMLIADISTNFGGYSALLSIIACGILYFFSSVYSPYSIKPTDYSSSGLGDYEKAVQTCIPVIEESAPSMFDKFKKVFK